MTLDEKKESLRYLLKSIFIDECSDVSEDRLIGFYLFLLNYLEVKSDAFLNADSDDYFVVQSVIDALSHFHLMDSAMLLHIIKNHENFIEIVADQTSLSYLAIEGAMERLIGEFQNIKHQYLTTS